MNHNAVIGTTPVLSTQSPLLQRLVEQLSAAWKGWRAQTRLDNELRALESLSDATLRDIGMAERVPQQATLSSIDYERGRW